MKIDIICLDNSKKQLASYKASTLNLFKSIIGSGVVALPYSFYMGGYVMSAIIFCFVGVLINYSQLVIQV